MHPGNSYRELWKLRRENKQLDYLYEVQPAENMNTEVMHRKAIPSESRCGLLGLVLVYIFSCQIVPVSQVLGPEYLVYLLKQ